jgi:glucose 1-dehydrogenase
VVDVSSRRTAIVTGASTGIGRGIALKFASLGYDLVLSHLNEPVEMASVEEQIRALGRACVVRQCDLTDAEAPGKLIAEAIEALGTIDVLVSNAGVARFSSITEMKAGEIDQLYSLLYRAPVMLFSHVGRHMIEKGVQGNIVQITSSRGTRAYPADAVYGGMKAAMDRSIQSIALEYAPHGIRVNAVAPGAIQVRDTNAFHEALGPRIPLGRMGQPADVAEAVAYLCSDAASYVTGITLRVDGGLILPGMPESVTRTPNDSWGTI